MDDFKVFITNLGKYNEGYLLGEWVTLPTTREELKEAFKRIGIGQKDDFGHLYEEWFITDYEVPSCVSDVYDQLGEYEDLDLLNYFAVRLDEMEDCELDVYEAVLEAGLSGSTNLVNLINLTFNLDSYELIPDVDDDDALGTVMADELYSEEDLGQLANYIDYERYGRDIRLEEGGCFTSKGCIRENGYMSNEFNGIEDVPGDFLVIRKPEDQHGKEV